MYTYTIGQLVTIDSEIEISLFDTRARGPTPEPELAFRVRSGTEPVVERAASGLDLGVPSSWAFEWTDATGPVRLQKLLFSAIQATLLEQGATLCFGSAFRTPDGTDVAVFGPSNCGKSTAAFRLARRRDHRIAADDLLVCHAGTVFPFPRYMNLPRDVPAVRRWLESADVPADRILEWPEEVGVPRRLVSESVPSRLDLDRALLVAPDGSPDPGPISPGELTAAVARLNETVLAGWTAQPDVWDAFEGEGTDREPLVRAALADADCSRLDASGETLAESVVRALGR